MANLKLTKRLVDALSPGETVFDTEVRGFGIRHRNARKIYVLKTSIHGRPRWFTIGEHGAPWTVDTARTEAQRLWGEIRSGTNLVVIREARRTAPLVSELCTRFLDEHARQHKKPSSIRMDEMNIQNHILPELGDSTVMSLSREDVDRFKRRVRDGKTAPAANRDGKAKRKRGSLVAGGTGAANRCIALLSKMLNLAEVWGWRPEYSNPCRSVERYREHSRQRYLSTDEVTRLAKALEDGEQDGTESPYIVAAIRLLLLTGARAGEILSLEWTHVDLERGLLLLPDSKTGQKVIYLSSEAASVLTSLPRAPETPYVIAGLKPGVIVTNVHKPWKRILKRAKIEGVRIHDLRHSFASAAAASGASLLLIGRLLGHTDPQTTQRYSHLVSDPIREANDKVGSRLAAVVPRKKAEAE
jgi:integrase